MLSNHTKQMFKEFFHKLETSSYKKFLNREIEYSNKLYRWFDKFLNK